MKYQHLPQKIAHILGKYTMHGAYGHDKWFHPFSGVPCLLQQPGPLKAALQAAAAGETHQQRTNLGGAHH
jgi:hypothetical protein